MNVQPKQNSPIIGRITYESLAHRTANQRADRAAIMAALRAGASSREALTAVDGQGGGVAEHAIEHPRQKGCPKSTVSQYNCAERTNIDG